VIERWSGVAGAMVFIGVGVWSLTRTQRRRSAAIGSPAWTPLVLVAVGITYAWGAWVTSFVPTIIGILLLLLTNRTVQQRQRGLELPPKLVELQDLGSNPLHMVRHPVATLEGWARFLRHPIKSNRQTREWFNERGL
jgi:hypothetical protein